MRPQTKSILPGARVCDKWLDNKRCPPLEILNNGSIITMQSSDMRLCLFAIQNIIGFGVY